MDGLLLQEASVASAACPALWFAPPQPSARLLGLKGAGSGASVEFGEPATCRCPITAACVGTGQVGKNEESGHAYAGEETSGSPGGPIKVLFWIKD